MGEVAALARELVGAWGCWAPTLTRTARGSRSSATAAARRSSGCRTSPPARRRRGYRAERRPGAGGRLVAGRRSGSPARSRPAAGCAPRCGWCAPTARGARRVAGGDVHAVLGPWARDGHGLVVTVCSDEPHVPERVRAARPAHRRRTSAVAVGELIDVLDLTADARFALLRDGTRGAQFCRLVDRLADVDLPGAAVSRDRLDRRRPAAAGAGVTTRRTWSPTSSPTPACRGASCSPIGIRRRRAPRRGRRARRARDAELEFADADAAGALLVLVWNVEGRSEVRAARHRHRSVARTAPALPGEVVTGGGDGA